MEKIIQTTPEELDLLIRQAIEMQELNQYREDLSLYIKENRDNLLKYWGRSRKEIKP